jgi:hypothetical protein
MSESGAVIEIFPGGISPFPKVILLIHEFQGSARYLSLRLLLDPGLHGFGDSPAKDPLAVSEHSLYGFPELLLYLIIDTDGDGSHRYMYILYLFKCFKKLNNLARDGAPAPGILPPTDKKGFSGHTPFFL